MYYAIAGKTQNLQQHHHVTLDLDFRNDCKVWLQFLNLADEFPQLYCRPFMDLSKLVKAKDIFFYTDASARHDLGCGGIFMKKKWFFLHWEKGFIHNCKPCIQYLELYAVCIGLFAWATYLRNLRILVHCDNSSVVRMINLTTSDCNCMHLVRRLVLFSLKNNTRVFAAHVKGNSGAWAKQITWQNMTGFKNLGPIIQNWRSPVDKDGWLGGTSWCFIAAREFQTITICC